ncbi:MAG: HAMP domain-containing histidine kinase [Anaerolineae bacterium]|nr:HAMP domain-containing histidine kinase [Anaerolineae bacterium]
MATDSTQDSTHTRGLQPTFEELCQNTQLLIQLRWVAGLGILFATLFTRYGLAIELRTLPLLLIGLLVLSYNSILFFACREEDKSLPRIQRVAWGQVILDWLAMIALVHFTGGITSPTLIYFVIHAALSGTILLPWQTRRLILLAIVIVGGLAWLERAGTLPHVTISDLGLAEDLYKNTTYIFAVMAFFGSTVFVLSELVTRNAQRLRQREQHIRELYEARSTFVRVATHELRAPLGAALSLMRNIEQGYAGELSPQQAGILSRVTSRLEGLSTLVDDLLTLARIREASTAHAPLKPDSVRTNLDKIIEQERPHAEQKQITLHCDLDHAPGIVMAGNVGLNIIFGNLINNAIKYTPEGGDVTIDYTVLREQGQARVSVTDTGIGIPADDLPNVFSEFFRAKNAKRAQITGTGIGLSTVYALVQRYNGEITLESVEGQGTTIIVTLPLTPHQTPAKSADDEM